jgi:hypothetical protein
MGGTPKHPLASGAYLANTLKICLLDKESKFCAGFGNTPA